MKNEFQGQCFDWSEWSDYFPSCMTLPGETVLDGPEYRPKRKRVCDSDESLIETEMKSDQDPGIEFLSCLVTLTLSG